ncbi:hypothetical protein [Streptomyces sp. NPDC056464]|uniref:hypothetical protein n=1 Tax=Streptomyces sp. NPDC056464 TaxID=3345828 RepID=UPI003676A847
MKGTAGVAAAAGMPASAGRGTPPGPKGSVGTAHVIELREGLRSLYQLDGAYGGGDVRSLARKHLKRIERIVNTNTYPDTIGRQLQLLSGETAEHCGWLYYDADNQTAARVSGVRRSPPRPFSVTTISPSWCSRHCLCRPASKAAPVTA